MPGRALKLRPSTGHASHGDLNLETPPKTQEPQERALTTHLATLAPRIDVRMEGDKMIVAADMPGVPKDSIRVQVDAGVLTVSGERTREVRDDERGYFERQCGRFERSVRLPERARTEGISARHQDGVLVVEVPTEPAPEPMRIDVQ